MYRKSGADRVYQKHKDIDFVISTIGLGNVTIPHIVVSPLLEPADEKKLSAFMQQLDTSHRREQKRLKC